MPILCISTIDYDRLRLPNIVHCYNIIMLYYYCYNISNMLLFFMDKNDSLGYFCHLATSKIQSSQLFITQTKLRPCFCLHIECWVKNTSLNLKNFRLFICVHNELARRKNCLNGTYTGILNKCKRYIYDGLNRVHITLSCEICIFWTRQHSDIKNKLNQIKHFKYRKLILITNHDHAPFIFVLECRRQFIFLFIMTLKNMHYR